VLALAAAFCAGRAFAAPLPDLVSVESSAPTTGKKQPVQFKIARIRFEGVKIMPAADLALLARKIENSKVTLARLKQFTAEIRQLYQKRGYLLARASVPPQKLKPGGDVRVVISEGYYGKVKV